MAAQQPARALPERRKAPFSPRYRRNYTTSQGTTLNLAALWKVRYPGVTGWLENCRARPSYELAIVAHVSEQQIMAMRDSGARYGSEILAVMEGLESA